MSNYGVSDPLLVWQGVFLFLQCLQLQPL